MIELIDLLLIALIILYIIGIFPLWIFVLCNSWDKLRSTKELTKEEWKMGKRYDKLG